MAGEGEDITIICSAWTARVRRENPGSVRVACAVCGRRLTHSRQGQALKPDPGFEKRCICIRCAQQEAPDKTATPVPGAVEQLAELTGNKADAIMHGSEMRRVKLKDFDPDQIDGAER
jgi:hypothetical protein